ncbi:MAG: glycosyltransferase [Rubellimicrobium sp.]|nr:glycosyltransferase [Rubellimicrobium sp.]
MQRLRDHPVFQVWHVWRLVLHAWRLYRARHRGTRRWLVSAFLRDGWRARRAARHWLRHGDAVSLARIKAALRLTAGAASGPLDARLRGPPAPVSPARDVAATIIMPVFDAFDILPLALGRVVAHSDGDWRLIVVEDCSSDPRLRPWLRVWHAGLEPDVAARVVVVENDENLGFVGAVNRALALAVPGRRHVVLLNSDALVPQGWLSRLLAPILADATVASVTPMSNEAEIFTAPVIGAATALRGGEGDAIDRAAARLPPALALAPAPTGVGFCMALNAAWLARVPRLDVAFGRGYGEEVDWCLRTAALGGRHLGTAALFVEHRGTASFAAPLRDRLRRDNGALLRRRYPRFDRQVQAFVRDDPLRSARLALALAWAGARMRQVPVVLAHSMGGGAELVLHRQITALSAQDGACVVLRVGGVARWRIEVHAAAGVTSGETDDTALLRHLTGLLPARRIVYSCGAGDRNPVELPGVLLSLARPGDRVEVLLHDYLPVSPSWTLLDADGHYRGLPDPAPLACWQAAWGALLQRADRITAFSPSSAAILAAAFPDAAGRIAVTPHEGPPPDPVTAPRGGPVIGIPGNIGPAKGAAVVQALARHLARHGGARLVVLGTVDPAFRLPRTVRVHGSYAPADIPALARRYGIDRWFIPSIWPETFSFTTHEALATGLPVWCFDLGAQAEAVRSGRGGVIPLPRGDPDAAAILAAIAPDRRIRRRAGDHAGRKSRHCEAQPKQPRLLTHNIGVAASPLAPRNDGRWRSPDYLLCLRLH